MKNAKEDLSAQRFIVVGSLSYSIYRLHQSKFLQGKNMEKKVRKRKGKETLPCGHLERVVMGLFPVQLVMMDCRHAFC